MFYASSRRDATRCDAARHSTARQRARRDLESRQRTREMAITKEFNVPVDRYVWFEARANVGGALKRRRCVAVVSKRRGRIERVCGRARWRRGARTRR